MNDHVRYYFQAAGRPDTFELFEVVGGAVNDKYIGQIDCSDMATATWILEHLSNTVQTVTKPGE